MSLVDSTAAFGAHVDVIDPGGALKALLDGQGLKTFSQLHLQQALLKHQCQMRSSNSSQVI